MCRFSHIRQCYQRILAGFFFKKEKLKAPFPLCFIKVCVSGSTISVYGHIGSLKKRNIFHHHVSKWRESHLAALLETITVDMPAAEDLWRAGDSLCSPCDVLTLRRSMRSSAEPIFLLLFSLKKKKKKEKMHGEYFMRRGDSASRVQRCQSAQTPFWKSFCCRSGDAPLPPPT